MKKVFISIPSENRLDEEIMVERERCIAEIEKITGDKEIDAIEGDSFDSILDAELVYFADGWRLDKKCRTAYVLAKQYGIEIITE